MWVEEVCVPYFSYLQTASSHLMPSIRRRCRVSSPLFFLSNLFTVFADPYQEDVSSSRCSFDQYLTDIVLPECSSIPLSQLAGKCLAGWIKAGGGSFYLTLTGTLTTINNTKDTNVRT